MQPAAAALDRTAAWVRAVAGHTIVDSAVEEVLRLQEAVGTGSAELIVVVVVENNDAEQMLAAYRAALLAADRIHTED